MTTRIDRLVHLPVALVHLPSSFAARLLGESLVLSWAAVFDDPPPMCDGRHDGGFCDECDL